MSAQGVITALGNQRRLKAHDASFEVIDEPNAVSRQAPRFIPWDDRFSIMLFSAQLAAIAENHAAFRMGLDVTIERRQMFRRA